MESQVNPQAGSRRHFGSPQMTAWTPRWMDTPAELPVFERADLHEVQGPVELRDAAGGTLRVQCVRMIDGHVCLDWGRMPDTIPGRGAALAVLAHHLLERLETPALWLEFSKGLQALALRKGNRFGSAFNELGESLQLSGVRTHRIGLGCVVGTGDALKRFQEGGARLWIREVVDARPLRSTILGRTVHAFHSVSQAPNTFQQPHALPFEVKFRFRLPRKTEAGGPLDRMTRDPGYLIRRGFRSTPLEPGRLLDFPVLELFTTHEPTPRALEIEEALALASSCGYSSQELQKVLFLSAWVAGFLRQDFEKAQVDLVSGRLRWARDLDGAPLLISMPGTEELELQFAGTPLDLSYIEQFHAGTPWANAVKQAREWESGAEVELPLEGGVLGAREWIRAHWKKRVPIGPRPLIPVARDLAAKLHPALVSAVTRAPWFSEACSLERWVTEVRSQLNGESSNARSN